MNETQAAIVAGMEWPADVLDDPEAEVEAGLAFNRAVHDEAHRLRVRAAATRVVARERATAVEDPPLVGLEEFLAVPDEPQTYRVEGLWPAGGRVVLAAQFKAGKSTLLANLVRALVDGGPFLGTFPVNRPSGRVVLIDDELDERMLRRWLRDQGIANTGRVVVLPIRGRVAAFDLLDDECRARWGRRLREVEAGVVILDCLRPVLDALGLSEDKDAGRFLVAFDALLTEAGVSEAVVNHHAGHGGERSRGDSRIRDWPDVEWRLVREASEDGETDAGARRYFAAYGRDVDVPEGLLTYGAASRRLSMAGGTRRETAADSVIPDVISYLEANPGSSGRQIEAALGDLHKRAAIRTALDRASKAGRVDATHGPKRAVLHFVGTPETLSAPSAPSVRQRTEIECASAPIGRTAHSHTEGAVRHGAHAPAQTERPAPAGDDSTDCTLCGSPLLFHVPGRTVCERCRIATTQARPDQKRTA